MDLEKWTYKTHPGLCGTFVIFWVSNIIPVQLNCLESVLDQLCGCQSCEHSRHCVNKIAEHCDNHYLLEIITTQKKDIVLPCNAAINYRPNKWCFGAHEFHCDVDQKLFRRPSQMSHVSNDAANSLLFRFAVNFNVTLIKH